jgi:hypothetical protein
MSTEATPAEAQNEIRRRLCDYILAGGSPKEFAFDNKMHEKAPGKILAALGIRKIFVTEAEQAAIMEMRKLLKQ